MIQTAKPGHIILMFGKTVRHNLFIHDCLQTAETLVQGTIYPVTRQLRINSNDKNK